MSTTNFSIQLGSVDLDRLISDDDFREEADRLLPTALTSIGERIAESAWDAMQKSLKGIPGVKVNSSSKDKSHFIREGGQRYLKECSLEDKVKIHCQLIEDLRELKTGPNDRP